MGIKKPKYDTCECYFVKEEDGEYISDCQVTGKCPLDDETANRCVSCGDIIPEGQQICPNCRNKY